jgi:molybdopterin synthase catalytic subunit
MMTTKPTSLGDLIQKAKSHPHIEKAGMILCHNGIVRAWDRDGAKKVRSVRVAFDQQKIEEVRSWAESQPGIVCVLMEAFEGELKVGDDLLFIVIAGDIRENVLSAMRDVIDKAKATAVQKTEIYED